LTNMSSVLHIVQTPLDHIGGPAVYVKELSKRLALKGIKVGIVAPQPRSSSEVKELQKLGITVYHVPNNPLPHSFLRAPWIFSVKAHKIVKSILNEFDIVNVHVESTFLQVTLDTFKEKTLVATVHGFPILEDLEALKSRFSLYKLIHLLAISPQHLATLAKLVDKSHMIITLSNQLKKTIAEFFGVSSERSITIPNGVDTEVFKPVKPEIARAIVHKLVLYRCNKDYVDERVLLYLARLEPIKGVDILVRAVARLNRKDWFLLLVGPVERPEYVKYLKNLAEKLGIREKVCIVGSVPHNVGSFLYSASYVYILPSLFEGLPASILEAMACKTPVIASGVGGIPEVIANGYNGILVEPNSPRRLSEVIENLLEDAKYRDSLALRAYRTAQYFSWDNIAGKYYKALIQ